MTVEANSVVPINQYHNNARQEMIDFIPSSCKRLLDVGCYTGSFAAEVKRRFSAEVWGLDPNQEAIAICQTKIDHAICSLFDSSAAIPDHYFDVITFNDSLEHFPYPEQALELSRKKLAKNGVIVCSIPNMRQIDNIEHLLIEKNWQYEDSGVRDRTHLRFFTQKSIISFFVENGYSIQTIQGVNPRFWQEGKYLRRILFRLFPKYMEDMKYIQFAVVAEPLIANEH